MSFNIAILGDIEKLLNTADLYYRRADNAQTDESAQMWNLAAEQAVKTARSQYNQLDPTLYGALQQYHQLGQRLTEYPEPQP